MNNEKQILFPYVSIWFDVPKCIFILKRSNLKTLVVFSWIIVAETKIILIFIFHLKKAKLSCLEELRNF